MHPIARKSLEANIVQTKSGPYLAAGGHHFGSLWTRDFCFSIRALLQIQREDVVKNHLTGLIKSRRATDGLVARVVDSISPQMRVIAHCGMPSIVRKTIARPFLKKLDEPLIPEWVDEHGSESIDSNLSVLLGAMQYYRHTRDLQWWQEQHDGLLEIWGYYRRRRRGINGPIVQGPFTDWQDSLDRSGYTLYTNVLLYRFLKEAADLAVFGVRPIEPENFRSQTLAEFYWPEKKLWRSQIDLSGRPVDQLSLDYHLLGLECGFFDNPKAVYQNLKDSELWSRSPRGLPGFNSARKHSADQKTWAVRLAGLERYHEDIYWSWLMNLSARVAFQMGDNEESLRIQQTLHALFERDQTVCEIYDPKDLRPFRSRLYQSENPFSWGC